MFVVTVTFIVAKDRVDAFLPLMLENASRSLSEEPGCQRFDVCQHPDRPEEIFLYEVYNDAAAFDMHLSMPHFLDFSKQADPMVTSKSVQTYNLLGQ